MKKILIVDDNSMNLDILRHLLKDQYKLSFAKNGQMALKLLEKIMPDLILLDVMMPVMDGYEAYRTMIKNRQYDHIPVIFLSGIETLDEEIYKLDPSRKLSLIKKPFDQVLIKANISEFLA